MTLQNFQAPYLNPGRYYNPMQYGVRFDGVTDDSDAWNKLINEIVSAGGGVVDCPAGMTSYISSGPIYWDHGWVSLKGNGCTIKSAVTGYAMYFQTQAMVSNYLPQTGGLYSATIHSIDNLNLAYTSTSSRGSGNHAVFLGDPATTTPYFNGANIRFKNCSIHGFDTALTIGSNTYNFSFTGCQIFNCTTIQTIIASAYNSGEKSMFIDCNFFNSTYGFTLGGTGGGVNVIFETCSFDYLTQNMLYALKGSYVVARNCHFEGSSDSDYWIKTSADTQTIIILDSPTIFLNGKKTQYEFFQGLSPDSGITITGKPTFNMGSGGYFRRTLGNGYVRSNSVGTYTSPAGMYQGSTALSAKPVSLVTNILSDGGFDDTGTASQYFGLLPFQRTDWQITSGGSVISQNTTFTDGSSTNVSGVLSSASLSINLASNVAFAMSKTVPIGPGGVVTLSGTVAGANLGATDSIEFYIKYITVDGTTPSSYVTGTKSLNAASYANIVLINSATIATTTGATFTTGSATVTGLASTTGFATGQLVFSNNATINQGIAQTSGIQISSVGSGQITLSTPYIGSSGSGNIFTMANTSVPYSFTEFNLQPAAPAPQGTAAAVVSIFTNTAGSSATAGATIFLDNLILETKNNDKIVPAPNVNTLLNSNQYININTLGIYPNATQDQTAAIQLAICTAVNQNKGLYFPAGTYCYSSMIYAWCSILGEGNGQTIFQHIGGASCTSGTISGGTLTTGGTLSGSFSNGMYVQVAGVTPGSTITISGGTASPWTLTGASGVTATSVQVTGFQNGNTAVISHATITSGVMTVTAAGTGTLLPGQVLLSTSAGEFPAGAVIIEKQTSGTFGGAGTYQLGGPGVASLTANPQVGIWYVPSGSAFIYNNTNNFTFSGNYIYTPYAVSAITQENASHLKVTNCSNYSITNNKFQFSGSSCVLQRQCTNGIVENNYLLNLWRDGIASEYGSKDILIKGNMVENSGDDAIDVVGYVTDGVRPSRIKIIGNTVKGTKYARGIAIVGARDVIVADNHVFQSYLAGVYVASDASFLTYGNDDIDVHDNIIDGCGNQFQYGLSTQGVMGAVYLAARSDSIGVYNNYNVKIHDNIIKNSAWHAINTGRSTGGYNINCDISRNQISSTYDPYMKSGVGIVTTATTTACTVLTYTSAVGIAPGMTMYTGNATGSVVNTTVQTGTVLAVNATTVTLNTPVTVGSGNNTWFFGGGIWKSMTAPINALVASGASNLYFNSTYGAPVYTTGKDTTGAIPVGMWVSGTNIPANTFVIAVNTSCVTLSNNTTASIGSGNNIVFTFPPGMVNFTAAQTITANTSANTLTITSSAGMFPGMIVTDTNGFIPAGTFITNIPSTTSVQLSQNLTAPDTSGSLTPYPMLPSLGTTGGFAAIQAYYMQNVKINHNILSDVGNYGIVVDGANQLLVEVLNNSGTNIGVQTSSGRLVTTPTGPWTDTSMVLRVGGNYMGLPDSTFKRTDAFMRIGQVPHTQFIGANYTQANSTNLPFTLSTYADLTANVQSLGASPFNYTNNTYSSAVDLVISGSNVSDIQIKRFGLASYYSVAISSANNVGCFRLMPGDSANIVYSGSPSVTVIPLLTSS